MDNVLRTVLNGTGLTYSMERDIVTISKVEQQGDKRSATGIVSDEEGYPLPGVNVVISDLQRFAITDNNGKYNIEIPTNTACTITFSYIGMSTQQVMINSGRNDVRKNITLKSDTKLDEVIVTGIYTRKAESFTGAATTISSKDLMRVGNQNVFQSLKIWILQYTLQIILIWAPIPIVFRICQCVELPVFQRQKAVLCAATIKINPINLYSFLMVLKQLLKQ